MVKHNNEMINEKGDTVEKQLQDEWPDDKAVESECPPSIIANKKASF